MIVNSTEIQNNFGKYLMHASKEDIIITRNGTPIAKLTAMIEGVGESKAKQDIVMETAEPYRYEGQKATYEEFLALTNESEERYEYIDGEIYLLASPRTAHQYAQTRLFGLFYNWHQGGKCMPFAAPYDIKLYRSEEKINVVQPDLMIICDLEEHLDDNDYYQGVPALVVEIISESTRRKDLVKKLDLYMSCGIREYWVVNPFNREITIYLFEDSDISSHATYKRGEIATSFLFEGLSAALDDVFRES